MLTRNLRKILNDFNINECFVEIQRQLYAESCARIQMARPLVERRQTTDCIVSENDDEDDVEPFNDQPDISFEIDELDILENEDVFNDLPDISFNIDELDILENEDIGSEVVVEVETPLAENVENVEELDGKENNQKPQSFMEYYQKNKNVVNTGSPKAGTSSFIRYLREKRNN